MAPNADYIKFKETIGQVEKAFDIQLVLPEYDRLCGQKRARDCGEIRWRDLPNRGLGRD